MCVNLAALLGSALRFPTSWYPILDTVTVLFKAGRKNHTCRKWRERQKLGVRSDQTESWSFLLRLGDGLRVGPFGYTEMQTGIASFIPCIFFFELLTSLLCALWPFLVFFGVGKNESGHMGHWLARSGQVPLAWERQTAVLTGKVGVGWSQEEAYERERTVVSCPPLALLPRRVITHLLGTRQGLSFVFSSIRWCALLPFCIQTAEQRGHTYIFIFIVFLHAHSSEKT